MFLHLLPELVDGGRRRGHYIADVVSAGRQCAQQGLIERLDQRAQAALGYPVKLETLARGHPQRVIGIAGGQVVAGQVLGWREDAAGNPATHHKHVFLASLAQVPVVLLIDSVELQELRIILDEVVRLRVRQRLGNSAR